MPLSRGIISLLDRQKGLRKDMATELRAGLSLEGKLSGVVAY